MHPFHPTVIFEVFPPSLFLTAAAERQTADTPRSELTEIWVMSTTTTSDFDPETAILSPHGWAPYIAIYPLTNHSVCRNSSVMPLAGIALILVKSALVSVRPRFRMFLGANINKR